MATPRDADAKHCATHDVWYGKLEQCGQCRIARAGTIKAGSPKADTTQKRVHAAEARLREMSCWERCKFTMQDDGHLAVKWSGEGQKWARLAMDLEAQITEIEHDQWLAEQKRILGGDSN